MEMLYAKMIMEGSDSDPIGKMNLANNSKMVKICNALENQGFQVIFNDRALNLDLETMGIKNARLDFYILKSSPKQVRARLRKKSDKVQQVFEHLAFHAEADLEYLRNVLQESLPGVATVGKFFYYGYRKGIHYYYAHIDMAEETDDILIKQIFLEKTLEQLKGVDSKIFRKVLDMSGLSRSSIVRLALTRIFRGATEPEELMAVVTREADRIVNAEEWKTVRNLVNKSTVNFMGNIIYILWEEITRLYMKKSWENLHK